MRTIMLVFVAAAGAPIATQAATVSVLADRVCLATEAAVPIAGGGVLEQTETYVGPLIVSPKEAEVEVFAKEEGDQVRTHARSEASLFSTGILVFARGEFILDGLPAPAELPVWDTSENPTLGARSTLRWVFRSDEATTAQLSLQHWSADGFVDVELVNLTTGVTLVDYESAVFFGQDHISDIPIAAGNRYDLRIRIGEFHIQDGDETQVFFDFGSPVTFVSSALPGGRKRAVCNRK